MIDVSVAVSDDHFLFALDAMFDVMVLYDWAACIPTIWFLIDGLMAHISCIRVQPQCSSISKALTSPIEQQVESLVLIPYCFYSSIKRRSSRQTC